MRLIWKVDQSLGGCHSEITQRGPDATVLEIYVDADACPVKSEVYRVAERHGLRVHIVAHQAMRVPDRDWIAATILPEAPDAADDWIAEHIQADDICITSDVPLVDRCLKCGARVIGPKGRVFTESSIGDVLATRNLLTHLRDAGQITGGPAPFAEKDRSRFLNVLHETIVAIKRAAKRD